MALAVLPILFTLTVMAAILLLQRRGQRLRWPFATIAVAVVTFVVGTFAVFDEAVLDALRRDADRLAAGEWWRLFSPLIGQDGGVLGLIFNVVMLLLAGTVVENLRGPWMLLTVYLGAGLVSELAAYTVMQGQGYAGNSVATLGLAGLIMVTAVVAGFPPRLIGIIGLIAGVVLIVSWDLHAVGFTVGALVGVAYALKTRARTSARRAASGSPGESSAGS